MFYLQRENKICGLCHPELVSGSLSERIAKSPLLERCLTGQEQSEILRSSSADLLQSNGLPLRMTNVFDSSNKSRHPEQSEESLAGGKGFCHAELVSASLTKRISDFPSPMEEGVGERVLPFAKVKPLKRIIKKCAFTLAEVLITLGIIGVVAAITIPSLYTSFRKRETASRVKAAYSIFSQAVKLSVEDNGEVGNWDLSDESILGEKYIVPYLSGATILSRSKIGTQYYSVYTLSSQGDGKSPYLDWSWNDKTHPVYVMKNGMVFTLDNANDGYCTIVVDINGLGKPNIMGIDGFAFWIDSETSTVIPAGAKYTKKQLLGEETADSQRICKRDNTWQYYRGGYCAALMQKDGWTISNDYPWGNGGFTPKSK